MPGVPKRIVVGPTTYAHFRHRHRDYYAPTFLFTPNPQDGNASRPTPPSPEECPHVWRYTVSGEHHNTVFFYNAATRASVWLLPIVHRDGRTEPLGEGEAMRVVDDSSGEDDAEVPVASATPRAAEASAEPRAAATRREGSEKLEYTARPTQDPSGGPSSASPRPAAAAATSSRASESGAPSETRVQAAVQRALEAESQRTAITLSTSAPLSPSSSSRPTLQDRLAAWRARQRGENVEPTASVEDAATPPAPVNVSASTPLEPCTAARASPPPAAEDSLSCVVSPLSHKGKSPPPTQLPAQPSPSPAQPAAVTSRATSTSTPPQHHRHGEGRVPDAATPASPPLPERLLPTAQERELARATALLHQEKVAAVLQERAALECRRRALAVEQAEAQERVRLAEARAAAEGARLRDAERAARAQAEKRAALEAAAATRSRAQEVNAYLAKQQALEEAAEAVVADSFTYATRIAAQLTAAARRPEHIRAAALPHSQPDEGAELERAQPRFRPHQVGSIAPRVDGSAVQPSRAAVVSLSPPTAPQRVRERVAYAAPHVYDGEVLTYRPSIHFQRRDTAVLSGRGAAATAPAALSTGGILTPSGPTPPIVLAATRDGAGTQYYDAAQAHFFRGAWREDRRDGAGVLSLPSTAVQGRWRADQLQGPGVLQTRRSKGTVTFQSGKHTNHASGAGAGAAAATGQSRSRPRSAIPATAVSARDDVAADTTTVTGNAVVELDTGALFVGALKEGRVRAPYVLQLGQGDYIEWLGASGAAPPAAASGSGSGVSAQLVTRTPPRRRRGASALSSSPSPPQSQPGTGECRIRFRNEDTYVGHVKDFQLHGFGYYRFAEDGHSYTGRFDRGLPHGEGLLICANGDVYRGGFAEGRFEGRGSYASKAGGYVYEGDWVAGEMEGAGSIAFANGDVWQGTFKGSQRVAGSYTALA